MSLRDTQYLKDMPNYAPRKRGRSMSRNTSRSRAKSSSSRSRSYGPIQTRQRKAIWPYASMGMSKVFDPFPAKINCLLRYATSIQINGTLGVASHYLFSCNGIFDPDITGTGHQPYGRDQYSALYNHYRVRKSTITITPVNGVNATFGCTITDDTTVQSDFDGVKETKGTKMAQVTAAGGQVNSVVQVFNVDQSFTKEQQQNTGAVVGSNPTEQQYFDVWQTSPLITSGAINFQCLITISYEVEYSELKDFGTS